MTAIKGQSLAGLTSETSPGRLRELINPATRHTAPGSSPPAVLLRAKSERSYYGVQVRVGNNHRLYHPGSILPPAVLQSGLARPIQRFNPERLLLPLRVPVAAGHKGSMYHSLRTRPFLFSSLTRSCRKYWGVTDGGLYNQPYV